MLANGPIVNIVSAEGPNRHELRNEPTPRGPMRVGLQLQRDCDDRKGKKEEGGILNGITNYKWTSINNSIINK